MRRLLPRRRAVSSMIGGMIVLALFLTALVGMVLVTQQYDTYQSAASNMAQRDIDRNSENLQAVYPGLAGGFPVTGCGGQCNQYNVSLANVGGIGVQIVQIYINSTQQTTGCTITNIKVKGPCVLSGRNAVTSFAFNSFDSYLLPGESNHIVRIWLPSSIVLPNATFSPSNSVWIVTSRGRTFSFSWPYPPAGQGLPGQGSPPTIYSGVMKIAYNGTDKSASDLCHKETLLPLPADGTGTKLKFLNPWITTDVITNVAQGSTKLYVAAYSVNSLSATITFSWGDMVILTADSTPNAKAYFIGGPYVGIVRNVTGVQQFTGAGVQVSISAGQDYYLIFQINQVTPSNLSPSDFHPPGDSFSGTATVNNGYGSWAKDASFREIEIFLDPLFVLRVTAGKCTYP